MSPSWTVARKEWRSAFLSPVALIFLGIFLAASLFVFFFLEGFFSRNVADARPFFRAMPILLIFLTSAFTMRLWSEESRSGTMEVLLTLPLRIREVVLGKFLAGLGLVVIALSLTLPVPLTISLLGDLDWGPVIGGYLGLLLLSAAYLSIGMFVSSLTGNQLVALMMSVLICGVFVLLGTLPDLVPLGLATDEVLRALGTGSRFASMLRGVLDLRDLVYYASLASLFLVLNGLVLEWRRWGHSLHGRKRHRNTLVAVALLAANLLALNLGLAPAATLRADLTEWREYSVSPVTQRLLRGVSEPLSIRGYFSDSTHPALDPLIPRIRDFLVELQTAGGPNVTVEFIDPTENEKLEKEANGMYGIRSVPFLFSDRYQDAVVNAYFHLLVRYGDRYEVLDYKELIDVEHRGPEVRVRLRNLEYDVARTVQKVVYGFKSIESICNRLPADAMLKVFASSTKLPEDLRQVPKRIEAVAAEFKRRCGGRFDYQLIDPDQPDSGVTPESLYRQYGIKPLLRSPLLLEQDFFYLDLVIEIGGKPEVLSAAAALTEGEIRKELEAALGRHSPGFLKTVGLVTPAPARPAYPGLPATGHSYENLTKALEGSYEVTPVDLSKGRVPGHVDVLVVMSPTDFGAKQRFAIDQFLMRGGSAIIAAGKWVFEPGMGGELNVKRVTTGLEQLLAHHGVEVGEAVVLDEQNVPFPVPVERDLGGIRVRDYHLVDYPPFVLVTGDGLSKDNPATATLPAAVMHWASAVRCRPSEEAETAAEDKGADQQAEPASRRPACQSLLSSSDTAWQVAEFSAQPDFARHGPLGFSAPEQRERLSLAVGLVGSFESFYKNREPPALDEGDSGGDEKDKQEKKRGRRAGIIERSERDARLVVLGSSSFVEDDVLVIARQISDAHLANLQLVANLTDWSVQEASLLGIRAKEQYARTLTRLEDSEKRIWEASNYGLATLAVLLIGVFSLGRRNRAKPILSDEAPQTDRRKTG